MVVDKDKFLEINVKENPNYVPGTARILAEYYKLMLRKEYDEFRANSFRNNVKYYSLIILTAAALGWCAYNAYESRFEKSAVEQQVEDNYAKVQFL